MIGNRSIVCSGALAGILVLLTGATGFTGRHLANRLTQLGARVRALARLSSDITPLAHLPIEWHRGDLCEASVAARAVEGVQVVMHMATSYRENFASRDVHYNVHVNGTKRLAEAAARQPDFQRFVHVSTIGVHGHIEDPPADENYRFAPGDDYQRTKLEAEQWVMQFGRDSGLPVVAVRPAAIYGPEDRRLLKVFKMASHRLVPVVGKGRCLYHLVHVEDLVNFITHVAVHPAAVQEAFICGNRDPITLQEFVTIAGRYYGVRNHFVHLPVAPIMALGVVCDRLCSPLGINPPLHPRRIAFFTKDRAFDTSKMRRLLDFETRYDNREGIESTALWYREHGWVRA